MTSITREIATADHIAKRLIDCEFQASRMSFPVPDTYLIEPIL
jgi:glycine cleavage system protein P-like pyridoxal-binding family